jgi:hypothetical protein
MFGTGERRTTFRKGLALAGALTGGVIAAAWQIKAIGSSATAVGRYTSLMYGSDSYPSIRVPIYRQPRLLRGAAKTYTEYHGNAYDGVGGEDADSRKPRKKNC